MKIPAPITFLPVIWLLFSSNASMAQPLDSQAIKAIDLKITPQPLAHLGFSNAKDFHEAVIGNLSQWRFPLHAENGQTYTHTMTVDIGEIKNAETPVGFSFSSGNSDPRALGFQKANVIPIQCRLNANSNPAQQAGLTMTFSAPATPVNTHKLQDTLVENISTVCFDLLDSLKFLPPSVAANPNDPGQPAEAIRKPTWMPSVQIETVPVPQQKPTLDSGSDAITPAKPIVVPDEERKQIIIHNQGSPLILKFGHERR
ncbi:MAG: hypothetical protein PHR16_13440 [Methylovulum sp.]|nr:hypothetical protein [Methylovulum sp.]